MGTETLVFLVIAFLVAGHAAATTTTTSTTTTTTTSPTPGITTVTRSSRMCNDTVPDCNSYKKQDLCEGDFQLYGAIHCRKTCDHCNDSCVDEFKNCSEKNNTEDICSTNYTWSLTHCEKFCGFCGVLGNTCDKQNDVFCKRIKGASCKENEKNEKICTCDAGFRPLADIECEELYWKKCNNTYGCNELPNSECKVPGSPGTTLAPWTNTTHCLCKPGFVYIHQNHSCDADCKEFPKINNGSVNSATNQTTLGSKANITCRSGFYAETPYITCEQAENNASWTNSSCKPVHLRTCEKKNDCISLFNSECKINGSKTCVCEVGYFYNSTNYSCDEVLQTSCKAIGNESLCTRVKHANCADNGSCICGPGFEMENKTSCKEVFNRTCDVTKNETECLHLEHSVCNNKLDEGNNQTERRKRNTQASATCQCQNGYYYHIENDTHANCLQGCRKPDNTSSFTVFTNTSSDLKLYKQGDVLVYNCTTGYTFQNKSDQQMKTSCMKNGTFQSLEICSIKDCKNLTAPTNGFVNISQGTTYGSWANFSCKTGYTLYGNDTSYCEATGNWSDHDVNCTIKDCKNLTAPTNGFVNISQGTTYGSWANFSCKTGYTLYGNDTSYCEATGNWSDHDVNCTIKDCKNLTAPTNGFVNISQGTTYGSWANFSCKTGYTLYGNDTSYCEATGNWSDHDVNCTIKDCKNLTAPTNGFVNISQGTTYGSWANFSCKTGYTLYGNDTSYCEATGNWSDHDVNCTIKDCKNLTAPTNGFVNISQGTTYGSWANFSCKTGYTLYGNDTSYCEATGNWSDHDVNCTIKDCKNLTAPTNGSVSYSQGTTFGSRASYSCDTGYTLYGNDTSDCEATGNWSDHNVNCTINDCKNLMAPTNGSVSYSQGTTFGSRASYSCDTGYTLYGNDTSDCDATGNWSDHYVNCTIKDCKNLTAPTNGSVSYSQGTTFGSRASYSCDTGYTLYGNDTSDCEATGNWSDHNVNCTINDCRSPKTTTNGNVSLDSKHTVYLHNATYVCNSGYETKNTTHVTCEASGNWSNPPPECIDIDECKRYTAKCDTWATCRNDIGGYTCVCKSGFIDKSYGTGRHCKDIDECAARGTNNCSRNGSVCVNYPGHYRCDCYDGWNGTYCSIDIDECKTNPCGKGANCNNTQGGFNCTCDASRPKGNPKVQCYENVVIQLETKGELFRGDNKLIHAKPFQHRFPYFGEGYTSYRPYMDGFIALSYQPIYESYGPTDSAQWKDVTHGNTVIAPLWTNIDSTNLTGGLYVHYFDNYSLNYSKETKQYKDLEKIQLAFNLTNFRLRQALVATWENVTMHSYIPTVKLIKTQNASMQVILISDGVYSYIMFNYDQELWSLEIGKEIPSSSGYSLADKTGFITANNLNYSKLNNCTNVERGLKGRWIYNTSSKDTHKNEILRNETECLEFGQNSSIKTWLKEMRNKSDPCPCSEVQIKYDFSFNKVLSMYQNPEFNMNCYEEWFFNNEGVKQTCCYRSGALEKGNIGGGFATFEPDKYSTSEYFYKCCGADGYLHLCHIFYEMNPSDDCSRYNAADEPVYRNKRSLTGYLKISSGNILQRRAPMDKEK